MSIDALQAQIRKLKNPLVVPFSLDSTLIPPQFSNQCENPIQAYCLYAKQLLTALKGKIPAVRFSFAPFALAGAEGLACLTELLAFAQKQKLYVLLDLPEIWSVRDAQLSLEALQKWSFGAVVISCFMGSDIVRIFAEGLCKEERAVFATLRTGNKSASELQDLLTGSRLVYTVAADSLKRQAQPYIGKSGYSALAGVGPATSADCLRTLRGKYPELFLLVDGFDCVGANAKNAACAFDKLGHGAAVCTGSGVVGAWHETDITEPEPVEQALQAVDRMQKNLLKYVTIL